MTSSSDGLLRGSLSGIQRAGATLLMSLVALVAQAGDPGATKPRVVAYVASWSVPATIPAGQLTHINYAFAQIDRGGRIVFERAAAMDGLRRLRALKKKHPHLELLISVGGWQAEGFSDAALTEASRDVFARSAVDFVRQHSLDGVDLDWEYPGQGVGGIKHRPEDKENFTRLLAAVRKRLDEASKEDGRSASDRLLLTIASADREYFEHTQMDKLHVHLDWINVMAYDFHNSLTPTTGHHAGLYAAELAAPRDRTVDASVRQHLAVGVPRRKLVLGLPFYGRGFAGVKPAHRGLLQPYERYEADHSYAELVDKLIGRQGYVRYWDERACAPFLWNETTRTFITYEDPQSLERKMRYVRDNGLGGVMFWELSQDRDGELLDTITRILH